jgi:hypothetical protein
MKNKEREKKSLSNRLVIAKNTQKIQRQKTL